MAEYLVNNTDLTSIANAIRTKGGTSEQLVFPSGFVSAVEALQTEDILGKYLDVQLGDYSNDDLVYIKPYTFYRFSGGAGNLRFPNVTQIGINAFYLANTGPVFFAPKAKLTGTGVFYGDSTLVTAIIGSPNGQRECFRKYTTMALTTAEFADTTTNNVHTFGPQFFDRCDNLTTLILRSPVICPIGDINVFGGTPFASGGSGGTVYIPKALYDHLGDGTALDYKAATNWSTIDSYGTITWAQIEGSIYETQYADGTPITT